MPARRCDRCLSAAEPVRPLTLLWPQAPGTEYHLCQRCVSALLDFFKGR